MSSNNKIPIIQWLILLVQGAIVGTGAILPGISGGVLLVAFSLYEPMMALFSNPVKSFKLYYKTFIPFLIGWAAGFVLLAGVVEMMFAASSDIAIALFAGLIFGTMPELMKKSEQSCSKQSWSSFALSLVCLFVLFSMLQSAAVSSVEPNTMWYVFSGMVWGLSLVVPGLSSSSILIYMGLYHPMTAGIASLNMGVILPLISGLAITVLLLAKLVNYLFKKKYALISRIVIGIMASSTLMIIPTSFDNTIHFLACTACFAVGFTLARWMDIAKAKNAIEDNQAKGGRK